MTKNNDFSYQELPVDKKLTDYVRRFWQFQNLSSELKQYTVLPDGYFDLIIKHQNDTLNSVTLFGIWARPIEVTVQPNTTVSGITFKPLAAIDILKQPIAHIFNSFTLLPINFLEINKLPFGSFGNLVAVFVNQIPKQASKDSRKNELFNLLFQSNGSIAVEELSQKVFWSSRQINRFFKDKFGLSLKAYSIILRCAASYTDIRDGELYPKQPYYDQAHFIKEVKKLTGFNPKQLHQNENDRFLQFSTLP